MMSMSISYETIGRTRQKARTRAALVESARALLAEGTVPTVDQAASAASISRATAYRYFPNQRTMLGAALPEIKASSLLGPDPPADVEQRLELVVRELGRLLVESEGAYRAMLRLSLEAEPADREQLVLRRGRAIGWIEDALSPLRPTFSPRELRRLAVAIRSAAGIEALVWLTDIAGLSRHQGTELMLWSAKALLRAALEEHS
jgi:AcrR family transcriptional regulator